MLGSIALSSVGGRRLTFEAKVPPTAALKFDNLALFFLLLRLTLLWLPLYSFRCLILISVYESL